MRSRADGGGPAWLKAAKQGTRRTLWPVCECDCRGNGGDCGAGPEEGEAEGGAAGVGGEGVVDEGAAEAEPVGGGGVWVDGRALEDGHEIGEEPTERTARKPGAQAVPGTM